MIRYLTRQLARTAHHVANKSFAEACKGSRGRVEPDVGVEVAGGQ